MKSINYSSSSLQETAEIAHKILSNMSSKILLLDGALGTGKTTLVKLISQELKIKDLVHSPTFNIMHIYDDRIVHIDAYRLNDNLNEFSDFFENRMVIIEWVSNLKNYYFEHYTYVKCSIEKNQFIFKVQNV